MNTTYHSMAALTYVGLQSRTIWDAGDEELPMQGEGKLLNQVFRIDMVLEMDGCSGSIIEDLQVQNGAILDK